MMPFDPKSRVRFLRTFVKNGVEPPIDIHDSRGRVVGHVLIDGCCVSARTDHDYIVHILAGDMSSGKPHCVENRRVRVNVLCDFRTRAQEPARNT